MRQFFISFMAALAGCTLSFFLAMIGFFAFIGIAASTMDSLDSNPKAGLSTIKKHSLLQIDLGTTIEERQTPADQFAVIMGENGSSSTPLNTMLAAVRHAADDNSIDGIMLKCDGLAAGMAQSEAIVRELNNFKKSGKWIYAYGDNIGQSDYFLASTADSVFINPVGMLDIHGLSSTIFFYKGLLEKIGVEMQIVKVGTFKSAVEPFMLTSISDANRLQTSTFLNRIWKFVSTEMEKGRNLPEGTINKIADSSCYSQPASFYIDNKLVNGTFYSEDLTDFILKATDSPANSDPRYVALSDYIRMRNITPFPTDGEKKIAVLYATGDITDNDGDGIVGSKMVAEITALSENKSIDGLILRVNSGGGSAFASEQIWEALRKFKQKTGKPFYVSMSDYAASGGYYISCGADRIFAEHLTLTGSIGIFGMIPNAENLLNDKLGVTTSTVATNPKGAFPGFIKAMTPGQRNAMQNYVDRGYALFTRRVAEGRNMPIDSVYKIAEGRVWDGATALEIGLVDRLGGLDDAIAEMTAELEATNCAIEVFPNLKFDFWKELKSSFPSLRTAILKSELGETYPIVMQMRRLRDIEPIQARMNERIDQ